MAKGQMRSTRETKKAKKKKDVAAPQTLDLKGISAATESSKKKKG